MKAKKLHYLFVFYFVISIACNALAGPPATKISQDEPATQVSGDAPTKVPLPVASGNGPEGFVAEATSADSVLLSWQAVKDAASYHLAVSTNEGAIVTVIDLPASIMSYEDFLVAPNSQLIYAVEALSDSGSIGQSVASVTTPARQPNPLRVLALFDTSAAVSQKIGPAGGSISIVDPAGVSYELSIPPNALEQETDISLIPLDELSEWPLDGEMIGAIGMEPNGLVLNEPALLTITPSSKTAAEGLATVGFSFEGYGGEFALRPVEDFVPGSSYLPGGSAHLARPQAQFMDAVRQWLSELRPAGAGEVSKDHAAQLVRENPPSDSVAAFDQKEAASLANEDDLTPLPKIEWLTRYNTFHRRIQEVTECHELTDAINFLQEASKLKDGGKDQTIRIEHENQAMDEVIEKTKDVLDNAGEECKGKKSEDGKFTNGPCTLQLIRKIAAGATPFYKELQTRLLQVYGKDVLVKAQSDIQNTCKPGYSIVGGAEGLSVNDEVCDITREFSVHGAVLGGEITITFTPNAAADGKLSGGGNYVYSGYGAGPAAANGGGSFTMMGELGSPVVLKASGAGSTTTIHGTDSAGTAENYMLTPVEYACARD